jgi:hypothetical protein
MDLTSTLEAASCLSAQEVLQIIRKPKDHYRVGMKTAVLYIGRKLCYELTILCPFHTEFVIN